MSYYEKYMKYKQKYLALKEQIGGSMQIPSVSNTEITP